MVEGCGQDHGDGLLLMPHGSTQPSLPAAPGTPNAASSEIAMAFHGDLLSLPAGYTTATLERKCLVVVVVRTVQLMRCVCPYPLQMHLIMVSVSLWTRPPCRALKKYPELVIEKMSCPRLKTKLHCLNPLAPVVA